jgi:two-component system, chemotaxis family, sensor kinase CheA
LKPKLNKRTLKKRISRTVYMASFLSIFLFSMAILIGLIIFLKPVSGFVSNFISNTITREMNSESFLHEQQITSLEQFNPQSGQAKEWLQSMDHITKLESYIPVGTLNKMEEVNTDAVHTSEVLKPLNLNFDFILLNIQIGDRVIYSNLEKLNQWEGNAIVRWLLKLFTVESANPLYDSNKQEIGQVTTMVAPQSMLIIFLWLALLSLILMSVCLLVSRLISKIMSTPLLKPLEQLTKRMKEIADESSAMDSQIVLIKPLREIEILADASNLIMNKMKDYSEKLQDQKNELEDQNEELEAQNEELNTSKLKLQEAQHLLIKSGNSIRNLLDNAGQGFLTFSSSLLVDPEYSQECRHLFNQNIEGLAFSSLITVEDMEQKRFIDNLLNKLFSEEDKLKRSIYFPLLPDEIILGQKHIHLDYKMIQSNDTQSSESIMVILTDISEKRELQSQMETERNILKMVVKVIVSYGDFTDCVRDFKLFSEVELQDILLKNESVKSKLLTIYRDIHTYKGNFSQFGLIHVVEKLHEAETRFSEMLRISDALSQDELTAEIQGIRISEWLEADMAILLSILGESFFNQDDLLLVDRTKILEIERKMLTILSPNECKILIPDLRKLRFKSFRELLKTYPEYIGGLAERMEKFIKPIEIIGGDFLADTEFYYDFSRSLIHVFRNMIDHAIESPEDRVELGKEESGSIRCIISVEENQICLELSDDGKGIDSQVIRLRALEKGIYTLEEVEALSELQIIEIIFHDQFSTKDLVSDISGRGIGLSSVKAEVMKLNGRIEVITETGKGTSFRFYVPYEELSSVQEMDFPQTLQPCIETTLQYFDKFAHLSLTSSPLFERLTGEKLTLKKVTSFVGFKGAVEGIFVMTVDEALSREMVRGIVLDPLTMDELDAYVEDALAETSNIILGNSIKLFQYFSDFMIMDPPVTIYTEGASIKYTDAEIWSCVMECEFGKMQISFVIMKRG